MGYNNTVAVLGANTKWGKQIAKGIYGKYRLLLMDEELQQLTSLCNEIQQVENTAEVNAISCCKNASWEADIIIIATALTDQAIIATKIKEVATCKSVIQLIEPGSNFSLLEILPHSKIARVTITDTTAIIESADEETSHITHEIMQLSGWNTAVQQTV